MYGLAQHNTVVISLAPAPNSLLRAEAAGDFAQQSLVQTLGV
jgi:hypothetical protein